MTKAEDMFRWVKYTDGSQNCTLEDAIGKFWRMRCLPSTNPVLIIEVNELDAKSDNQMHLMRDQVAELIPILQRFVKTGVLSKPKKGEGNELVDFVEKVVGGNVMRDAEVQDCEPNDDELYNHDHSDFRGIDDDLDDDDLEDYKQFTQPKIDPLELKRDLVRGVNQSRNKPERSMSDRAWGMRDALAHRIRCLDPSILIDDDIYELQGIHRLLDAIEERHGIKEDSKQRRSQYADLPPRHRSEN